LGLEFKIAKLAMLKMPNEASRCKDNY